MCGEFHNRTGIRMLKSIRPAHDQAFEAADQPAEQGPNSMDDVLNLAQVKAELCISMVSTKDARPMWRV